MKTTTTTIENKITGIVSTQTRLSNGTAAVTVKSPYDTSKVYQGAKPNKQLTNLFKSFGLEYELKYT